MTRARVAFLSAYFGMYDDVMPAGFRDMQLAAASRSRAMLESEFDILDFGMVTSESEGRKAGDQIRREELDVIVYAPTMVAPPAWIMRVLDEVRAPIVIWNAPQIVTLPDELDHPGATAHTSQVGCLMVANCLVRRDRWFRTVTASPLSPEGGAVLRQTVRAASVAGSLRRAIALRIGDPIAGYENVVSTQESLASLGVSEHSISRHELETAFHSTSDESARALLAELASRPRWNCVQGQDDIRSAKLALAIQTLCSRHSVTCGTINCHSDFFRNNNAIGITGCLGMSLMGELGVPLSCTGDLPAGLSMLIADRLSGHALYCETYVTDLTRGVMLIASGGDGDPRWADENGIRTIPNMYYKGQAGAGVGLSFRLAPGPATLISLSPSADGWRLAWATGEVTADGYENLDGPNGMFRFDRRPIEEAASAWISSGATHHHALARGRLDTELRIVAEALGIKAVPV